MRQHQPVPKAHHRYRVVTFTLVPGGTINRYLWMSLMYWLVTPTGTLRALGTGWCYQPVPKAHPWVTLKGKYLFLNQNCCVVEMVKGHHARLEVVGSNPSEIIFCLILEALGTGYFTWYQRLKPLVPLSGYRFKKPVPKANLNRCLWHFF